MPSTPLTPARDEVAFSEFATANLPLLQAIAYLMVGDTARSEALVRFTLAQLLQHWPASGDPLMVALRQLRAAEGSPLEVAPQRAARFELLDGPAHLLAPADGIVAELAGLEQDQRRALVLEQFVRLTPDEVADILDIDPAEAGRLARQARVRLAATDPAVMDDVILRQRLAEALPLSLRTAPPYEIEHARGSEVWWRNWDRVGLFVAAVALVTIAAVMWVWSVHPTSGVRTNPIVPTASARQPPPLCTDLDCRARTVAAWRDQIASVVTSYVDPRGTYFETVGFSSESRYESAGFWTGDGGVLGLDIVPKDGGATVIFVQIATDDSAAIPCGELSGQRCVSQRFMDMNTYTMTNNTTTGEGGLEVQYMPAGVEVVTIVVLDDRNGRTLSLNRGDLIRLVQDERLHLPHG